MPTIEEKYIKYMESVKKANKKYIETHREQINEKCRNYYHNCLCQNEDYKAKKRAYNKKRYEMKKKPPTDI